MRPWSRDSAPWQPVSAEPVSGSVPSAPPGRQHRRWDGDPAGEVRIGERRAAARHSDEHGTELRLEERWAAVRRDDAGRGRTDYRGTEYRPASDGRGPEPDYTRPALPASAERFGQAGEEPSWNDSWDEPVQQARGHRYRPEFELSDERWR